MQQLKQAISNTFTIKEDILDEFSSYWEIVSFPKGSILSDPNKTDKYLYFTISGIQKAYYLNHGKETIISFTQPNHFTCAPESFLTQVPSQYYFECITGSQFYRLSIKDFNTLKNKHHEILEFLLVALMGLVNNINARFIKQATLRIEEKFEEFMECEAHLINQIPHKDIANYLRMNPTNFSKLLNSVKV
ncbi:Crp/Fnr family transcriptional regulator [Flammeovirga aprica]|uniref:Crp/Fnr family transcriptional regulator n=1 Tax=Flammeovirga aprica JL-4 TaxID=694437 RepID=A0A7X9RYG4_9BACT|nr:Crp/Fnr family transcriptional regulator [Flammeovirga aprica]NME71055.1 Crp/Fnr family transcriptional regulator [Flammeovirga aprica JL-4]